MMKKLGILVTCALVLAGCSSTASYTSKVSDETATLATNDKLTITKQDFYEYLLDYYGAEEVLDEALNAIAQQEVTDEDKINELLDERVEIYEMYSSGGLDEYAKAVGYTSGDEYKEQVILPDVKQELLRVSYIEDHYDELMEEFEVCSIKKITVEKESIALNIISQTEDEETFDDLMEDEYASASEDCGIVTKNSALDDNLLEMLSTFNQVEEDGIYSEAIQLSDDTYAAVFIYETDFDEYKDDYQDTLANDDDVVESIQGYYLQQYEFTVNEEKLKADIKEISSEYISD